MKVFKKLTLMASAALALVFVTVASAAVLQQDLEFEQPPSVHDSTLPTTVDVSVTVDDADGSSHVTFSTIDNGVCDVQASSVAQAILGDLVTVTATLDLIGYGDCTVTARRAQAAIGPNTYQAHSITRAFKVMRDEPVTADTTIESLNGLPVIIGVEGKYHQACNGGEGFVLRAFPTKGVLTNFSNLICINDGEGGSVFQAQLVYTPLVGSSGMDSFKYAAVSHGHDDSTSATASVRLTPPVTVPSAPVLINAVVKGANVTAIFQAPASNGNSPILDYSLVATSTGGARSVVVPANETAGKIVGLEDGETYSIYVVARNSVGASSKSNEISVIIDDQPKTVSYSLAFRWSLVSWSGADGISVQDALAGTGSNEAGNDITSSIVAVYGWSGASQRWLAYFPQGVNTPGANDLTSFVRGQPYWMAVNAGLSWTVQVD